MWGVWEHEGAFGVSRGVWHSSQAAGWGNFPAVVEVQAGELTWQG